MCIYRHIRLHEYIIFAFMYIYIRTFYSILLYSGRQASQWYIEDLKMYLLLHMSDLNCNVGAPEGKTFLFGRSHFGTSDETSTVNYGDMT